MKLPTIINLRLYSPRPLDKAPNGMKFLCFMLVNLVLTFACFMLWSITKLFTSTDSPCSISISLPPVPWGWKHSWIVLFLLPLFSCFVNQAPWYLSLLYSYPITVRPFHWFSLPRWNPRCTGIVGLLRRLCYLRIKIHILKYFLTIGVDGLF